MSLAQHIKMRMKAKGISLSVLSRLTGLPLGTLRSIMEERSKHPRADTLQAIADQLGCTVRDLLEQRAGPLDTLASLQKTQPGAIDWHPRLYKAAVEEVQALIQQGGYSPKLDQVVNIIKEVYVYSLTHGETKQADGAPTLDRPFADWLVNRTLR